MYTITSLPYIDLSEYVDLLGINLIKNDIIVGIVKSRELITEGGASTYNCYNKTMHSIIDVMHNARSPFYIHNEYGINYEFYKKLNFVPRDCTMFAKYSGAYQQMGQVLFLRNTELITNKSLPSCYDTPAYINFNSLKEWITNCQAFDEIGRILIFLNSPNEVHSIHRDTFTGRPDNFIIINLDPTKKELSVYGDNNVKHVIDCKVSVFDIRNYHGTVGGDHPSWTLRIDGKFNKKWAESAGIWSHFICS